MGRALIMFSVCLYFLGCQSFPDPPVSFLSGLRVLGVRADPPQVAIGEGGIVKVLTVDTTGEMAAASWSRCLRAPLAGDAVNPDCVTQPSAAFLQPIGDGLSVTTTMPADAPAAAGQPDATGGVYSPLVARVTDPTDTVLAVYRWRLRTDDSTPANANPSIASLYALDASGAPSPLDEATPPVVQAGDVLTLGVTFAPGSAETYSSAGAAPATEVLTTSWFGTAGVFSVERTSDAQPHTVLRLDQRLESAAQSPTGLIDLYAVAHDERGGTDFIHRALQLK
ncbi:MAG TPA: hypothetical protein VH374_13430 [Polyangia bacterium]|jgi:hypothetical protein|nr:hypothetical protein [Polyangia bacterium]